jgi:hypothetical protein
MGPTPDDLQRTLNQVRSPLFCQRQFLSLRLLLGHNPVAAACTTLVDQLKNDPNAASQTST